MTLDITGTLQPDSTQINSMDLVGGPITVTVRDVSKGNSEQPLNIHLEEFPDRAYRPSKTMRRLIAHFWGTKADQWRGSKMTLYRNPEITFGREKVGGIEISALSNIGKQESVTLPVSRGKVRKFTVKPLEATAAPATITKDGYDALAELMTEAGIEDKGAWLIDQLQRPLQGWQEITTSEAAKLHQTLTQEDDQ